MKSHLLPAHVVLGPGPLHIEVAREIEIVEHEKENDHVIVAKGPIKSINFKAFFNLLEFEEEAKARVAFSIAERAREAKDSKVVEDKVDHDLIVIAKG